MAKQPTNRSQTAAQMREDAQIALQKASMTFTPEKIDDMELKSSPQAKAEEEQYKQAEIQAELLRAREIIAQSQPKEEQRPTPIPKQQNNTNVSTQTLLRAKANARD